MIVIKQILSFEWIALQILISLNVNLILIIKMGELYGMAHYY